MTSVHDQRRHSAGAGPRPGRPDVGTYRRGSISDQRQVALGASAGAELVGGDGAVLQMMVTLLG
jgi:hypothetical protein